MEPREFLERNNKEMVRPEERESSGVGILGIFGGIALLGVAALVIVSLPDIKRYIKISTM